MPAARRSGPPHRPQCRPAAGARAGGARVTGGSSSTRLVPRTSLAHEGPPSGTAACACISSHGALSAGWCAPTNQPMPKHLVACPGLPETPGSAAPSALGAAAVLQLTDTPGLLEQRLLSDGCSKHVDRAAIEGCRTEDAGPGPQYASQSSGRWALQHGGAPPAQRP
eukprot:CAMPEP_0204593026 /NCGR_PEP_ID=MMETSP0661-20131031/51272_1 /ASSEMBLY_ACC=CAM_ASM_000606 /TAXON_ID=109239 /ORGANISM="Alexandrium margalefi, Strain AMGDE01CS-322" /LENGTH=166 /DNA_ID=CAMNT_0051603295 /DNA_START=74 /DNA_END=571 /DNA_ORIENTATION=-